jgi:hypothetical protein
MTVVGTEVTQIRLFDKKLPMLKNFLLQPSKDLTLSSQYVES